MTHAFNPDEWLTRFEKFGGGHVLTPEGDLDLGFFVFGRSEQDQQQARAMMASLTDDERSALKEHLTGAHRVDDQWSRAMLRFKIAERAYEAIGGDNAADPHAQDELCSIFSDARWDLLKMPAPNRPALLWKLEYLFQGSGGALDPYEISGLAQVIADFRRLLGEG